MKNEAKKKEPKAPKASKIRMVSLDTSTSKTGYGYWENGKLKSHGCIVGEKDVLTGMKTDDMMDRIRKLFEKKKPDIVVVEMTVVVKNAGTQRELTELIGGIRWYCIEKGIDFHRLRPAQWRKLVKDKDEVLPKKRNELKKWSMEKVKERYGIECGDDEADGILIGSAYVKFFE